MGSNLLYHIFLFSEFIPKLFAGRGGGFELTNYSEVDGLTLLFSEGSKLRLSTLLSPRGQQTRMESLTRRLSRIEKGLPHWFY